MADEQLSAEKENSIEGMKSETAAIKVEPLELKIEHKPADYEYNSWSAGVSVPDGWERCPGYPDVIRRLKIAIPTNADNLTEAITEGVSLSEDK